MTHPDKMRHDIEACQLRLDMVHVVAALMNNSSFAKLVEHWDRYRVSVRNELSESRVDPYRQGQLQGQLRILDDLCQSQEEVSGKISELEAKIQGLQTDLKTQENRSFRQPPPAGVGRQPPPQLPLGGRVASFLPGAAR